MGERDKMTLRDYFAAAALAGLLASRDDAYLMNDERRRLMAERAWLLAEKMLERRSNDDFR
jgi:hypothetical protein